MQRLIGYLDFECVLVKTDQKCDNCATIRCKCDSSYTRFENEQKPVCFSFLIINQENEIMYSKTYSGDNAGDVFISDLLYQENLWIKDYLTKSLAMEKLNEEETIHFEVSESCYICNQYFTAAVSSSILRTIGSRTRKKFAKVLVEKLLKIGSNFPNIKSVYLKEWKLDIILQASYQKNMNFLL